MACVTTASLLKVGVMGRISDAYVYTSSPHSGIPEIYLFFPLQDFCFSTRCSFSEDAMKQPGQYSGDLDMMMTWS